MITLRPSAERGHADHGWLDARHTFSFASYHDPAHTHFRTLRVLNQDVVQPGAGFPTHGHADMEIVTWVLSGVLEHRDSMGNGSRILPGEVQTMSAGSGVEHSEFNASEDEELELLQMWVFPRTKGSQPRYGQREIPRAERQGGLRLVVGPDGAELPEGTLTIDQDARFHVGLFEAGQRIEHALASGRGAWLHVARGALTLNGTPLGPGDGAAIEDEPLLVLEGVDAAECVLWDLG